MIDRLAFVWVGGLAVLLIQLVDSVQVRQFLLVVGRTIGFSTLEHNVFLVVRQTGGLQRVVLAARTHDNKGLNLRFGTVLSEIDRQTIVKPVDSSLQRITFYGLIRVLFCQHTH